MKKIDADIIIIGAGLTGLSLAYYLRKRDLKVILIEARNRQGGRIHTLQEPGQAPVEMGATWVHGHHHATLALIDELGLSVFEQEFGEVVIYETSSVAPAQLVSMPPSGNPSYRIAGGSASLIERLSSNINAEQIFLEQEIRSIEAVGDSINASSDTYNFEGQMVISTLPPYLFMDKIKVKPSLPNELVEVGKGTRTWMGDSIKVALTYADRFWKKDKMKGTVFSKTGPMIELYDHSDVTDSIFALKGGARWY